MKFRPEKPEHSIVEAAFALHLEPQIDGAALARARELETLLRGDFDKVEKLQQVVIQMKVGASEQVAQPLSDVGMEMKKRGTDGAVEWLLRIHPNFVSANCLAYTRWDEVYPRCRKWLVEAGQRVVSESVRVKRVGIEFVDRYWHEPKGEIAPIGLLFRGDSRYLPPNVTACKHLWHLEHGWFVEPPSHIGAPEGSQILNTLKIATATKNGATSTTIRHQLVLYLKTGVSDWNSWMSQNSPDGTGLMDTVFSDMHEFNKVLLRDILRKEVSQQVGLEVRVN